MDLDGLLEKVLLLVESGDGGDVTEEAIVATGTQITTTGHAVPVPKKGHVDFYYSFATAVHAARLESQATSL